MNTTFSGPVTRISLGQFMATAFDWAHDVTLPLQLPDYTGRTVPPLPQFVPGSASDPMRLLQSLGSSEVSPSSFPTSDRYLPSQIASRSPTPEELPAQQAAQPPLAQTQSSSPPSVESQSSQAFSGSCQSPEAASGAEIYCPCDQAHNVTDQDICGYAKWRRG